MVDTSTESSIGRDEEGQGGWRGPARGNGEKGGKGEGDSEYRGQARGRPHEQDTRGCGDGRSSPYENLSEFEDEALVTPLVTKITDHQAPGSTSEGSKTPNYHRANHQCC